MTSDTPPDRRIDDSKIDELLAKVNEINQRQNEVVIPKLALVELGQKTFEVRITKNEEVFEPYKLKIDELWEERKKLMYTVAGTLIVAVLGFFIKKG